MTSFPFLTSTAASYNVKPVKKYPYMFSLSGVVMDLLGNRVSHHPLQLFINNLSFSTPSWSGKTSLAGRYDLSLEIDLESNEGVNEIAFRVLSPEQKVLHQTSTYPFSGISRHLTAEIPIVIRQTLEIVKPIRDDAALLDQKLGFLQQALKHFPQNTYIHKLEWYENTFKDLELYVFIGRDVLGNLAFTWIGRNSDNEDKYWDLYHFHPYGSDTACERKILCSQISIKVPTSVKENFDPLLGESLHELSHNAYRNDDAEAIWEAIRNRLTTLMRYEDMIKS